MDLDRVETEAEEEEEERIGDMKLGHFLGRWRLEDESNIVDSTIIRFET